MVATITDNPKVELLPKSSKGRFKTLEHINHQLINGRDLFIHKGFVSNGASVPKILWGIYSPYGTYTMAAIVHDYLYENNLYTRKFADRQFLIDMGACGTNKFTKWLFYFVVRIFGVLNWNKYKNHGRTYNRTSNRNS